jgi:hypothetical protein
MMESSLPPRQTGTRGPCWRIGMIFCHRRCLRFYVRTGVLLDAVCGKGILHDYLNLKVDQTIHWRRLVTCTALQAARRRVPTGQFSQASINVHTWSGQIDVIVFSLSPSAPCNQHDRRMELSRKFTGSLSTSEDPG